MSELPDQQTFDLAWQYHEAGDLITAERLYLRALAQRPRDPEITHQLGLIAYQSGRNKEATELFRQAIALDPQWADAYFNLGSVLQSAGEFDEAARAYRTAIALDPQAAQAHNSLGLCCKRLGKLDEALAAFEHACALLPDFIEARGNLGNALLVQGQFDRAVEAYHRVLSLSPDDAQTYCNLGVALCGIDRPEEAVAACRRSIELNPHILLAYANLASALISMGELDSAIAACREALALDAGYPQAIHNLGFALLQKGLVEECIAAYRHAIALEADFLEAHENLGTVLLLCGRFEEGWREYEWRWKRSYFPVSDRHPVQPVWEGEPLEGRTILLHEEYGLGDTIQFTRFVPLIEARGGRIIVECLPKLERLLSATFPNCRIIPQGQPLPPFDVHCPLMGLPKRFGVTLQTIPREMPQLCVDEREVRFWKDRLASLPPAFNIGLCWAASPAHDKNRIRSIALCALAPLGSIPGARFFSLQQGAGSEEAHLPPQGMQLVDWTGELGNFADAALIQNLDLIITNDTATAHLAGALRKPVWIMLPFIPDFRWLLNRDDSPWYPSARLFRQAARGNWAEVAERVAEALSVQMRLPAQPHAPIHAGAERALAAPVPAASHSSGRDDSMR